jgi:hypothetical protein
MSFISFRCNKQGDYIKVKLIDFNNNTYFKGEAEINNKSQMKNLFNQLREKGINFKNIDWFD